MYIPNYNGISITIDSFGFNTLFTISISHKASSTVVALETASFLGWLSTGFTVSKVALLNVVKSKIKDPITQHIREISNDIANEISISAQKAMAEMLNPIMEATMFELNNSNSSPIKNRI